MRRTKKELELTKERLNTAIRALQAELVLVEKELRPYNQTLLSEAFFWERIVPLLTKRSRGLSSSELHSKLAQGGNEVPVAALRTFLSRYKAKGTLIFAEESRPYRWQVSQNTLRILRGLGAAVPEQLKERGY
jgi:hypothetical protein